MLAGTPVYVYVVRSWEAATANPSAWRRSSGSSRTCMPVNVTGCRRGSATAPVRGAGSRRVLVQALRQVQALEHELDRTRHGGRRLVAAGERDHGGAERGHLFDQASLVGRTDVLTGVGDDALVEGGD